LRRRRTKNNPRRALRRPSYRDISRRLSMYGSHIMQSWGQHNHRKGSQPVILSKSN
jgi:hypothetical protein